MKDELKVFENRNDDWLAKERTYEAKVSAWDLDEGKRIKEEHAAHHNSYEQHVQNTYRPKSQNKEVSTAAKLLPVIIGTMTVIIFIVLMATRLYFGLPLIIFYLFVFALALNNIRRK
ncbi:MAG: hypothetical protein Q4B60_07420 [Erysipelotrichaceae bacterium]|nr:hypothetical protein [Erysipelotrichaceae bacterium]